MKTKLGFFVTPLVVLFAAIPLGAKGSTTLLDGYFEVSKALADDNLAAAKTSANGLAQKAHASGNHAVAEHASSVAGAQSISDARESFEPLSLDAIALAQGQSGYFVMTCPMAKADWLQNTDEVANPYMGKAMLKCGSIKTGGNPKSTQSGHGGHSGHGSHPAAGGCGGCGA